ncbi:MAG: UDP-N-acetylglucosamine 1-carboxyvinyltransferase [Oscillospiraceae bacterium]
MSIFKVTGNRPLEGQLTVQGAKNSVLPLLAATILAPSVSILRNCPDLSDVRASMDILRHLGCKVRRMGDAISVDATTLTCTDIPDELMRAMRSSVIFLGAILARCGCARMNLPGGCELGPRPIDLHLFALRKLGAVIEETPEGLQCSAPQLTGKEIVLSIPSVGATENAMLCAVAARGVTTIQNAAREPEIADLQAFLQKMGAGVWGAGGSVITVMGKLPLTGATHKVIGDRIVAATYLSAVAAAGGDLRLLGVDYRHLSTITGALSEAGCKLQSGADWVSIQRAEGAPLRASSPLRTAPYPGFPTDAQAPLMAAFCTAQGATMFTENVFSSRYRHVDELMRLGADIRVEGRVAVVNGVPTLHGGAVKATDLRGGAALVVAALGAEGETEISGLQHLDRGYAALEQELQALGAQIRRIS